MKTRQVIRALMLMTTAILLSAQTGAAPARVSAGVQSPYLPPQHKQAYLLDTGAQRGPSDAAPTLAFQHVVSVPGAAWLRLHISDYKLGAGSYLLLTSLEDNGWQRLDANSLPDWYNASAFFNGDAVRVELFVAMGDDGAFVRFDELTVGERGANERSRWPGSDQAPSSLCGADSRVASTDSRVGRLLGGGCTGWLVSNGAALTAGHCTDFDPDGSDPLLPDGVVDLNGVMEFNVPASQADGTPVWAATNDQYPVNVTGIQFHFDGEGQGIGKDWSVFRLNPNANTGSRAHATRGFFRMTNDSPAVGQTIRVTGFGADDNAQNVTNQTSTGSYEGEGSSGADFWHAYKVDTMPASSGSPIIWESNGFTIGIHTNGGCDSGGGGANAGTSFEHDPLETALQVFPAANTRYVDLVSAAAAGTGLIFQPFNTVGEAVSAVSAGGRVSIVAGTYSEGAQTINKALTLDAPVGDVVIR